MTACATCGATEGVDRYGVGLRCPACSPAGILGRTVPTPDPAHTVYPCPGCTTPTALHHKGDHR